MKIDVIYLKVDYVENGISKQDDINGVFIPDDIKERLADLIKERKSS